MLAALLVALGLAGCQPSKMNLVWDQPAPPASEVKAPVGFAVSPSQAYEAVRMKPWTLSLKHTWHIYADDKNYYVIDSFLGSSPGRALKAGIVVDGQTGAIIERTAN